MKLSQKRTISYAITERTQNNADLIYSVVTKSYGITVTKSKYPRITIERCLRALEDEYPMIDVSKLAHRASYHKLSDKCEVESLIRFIHVLCAEDDA